MFDTVVTRFYLCSFGCCNYNYTNYVHYNVQNETDVNHCMLSDKSNGINVLFTRK